MNFFDRLSPILIGATIAISQPQLVLAQNAQQVNVVAKKIAVLIDGAKIGSGVIIARQGNTYAVLTNWHVVDKSGEYKIQTHDGQSHSVNYTQIKRLIGADLAVVYFNSSNQYSLAQKANSDQLIEGQRVYLAGYPGSGSRSYRFYSENIIGFLLGADIQDGYEIIYSGEAIPGMSGSPILDEKGQLIGIYGRVELDRVTGSPSLYGISINTAQKLANRAGIELDVSVATLSSRRSTPIPVASRNSSSVSSTSSQYFTAPLKLEAYATTQDGRAVLQPIYYFTINLPENAGAPLQKLQFKQTAGEEFLFKRYLEGKTIAFEGTREDRGAKISLGVDAVIVDRENETITITFEPPISPGKKITIGLRPRSTPQMEGIFSLRLRAFPPGGERSTNVGHARLHFYGPI